MVVNCPVGWKNGGYSGKNLPSASYDSLMAKLDVRTCFWEIVLVAHLIAIIEAMAAFGVIGGVVVLYVAVVAIAFL
jgi:hypothetical protein